MPRLRKYFRKVRLWETSKGAFKAKMWYILYDTDTAERTAEFTFELADRSGVGASMSDAMLHVQTIIGQTTGTLDFRLMAEVPDEVLPTIEAMPSGSIQKLQAIHAFQTETYWEATGVR